MNGGKFLKDLCAGKPIVTPRHSIQVAPPNMVEPRDLDHLDVFFEDESPPEDVRLTLIPQAKAAGMGQELCTHLETMHKYTGPDEHIHQAGILLGEFETKRDLRQLALAIGILQHLYALEEAKT